MSKQSATAFFQVINTDPILREELSAQAGDVTQVNPGDKGFATQMVKFASDHGYDFDEAEARDAYQEVLENQLNSAGRELADQELEVVAGGAADSGCCATSVKLS
ncbi:MAG TPA: Nif11 family protein [Chloroflexia bacterium]|nr:Nif11 family protein [Chloroflexia bacterium]